MASLTINLTHDELEEPADLPEHLIPLFKAVAREHGMTEWDTVWQDRCIVVRNYTYKLGSVSQPVQNATVRCYAEFEPEKGVMHWHIALLGNSASPVQHRAWFVPAANINAARENAENLFYRVNEIWSNVDITDWEDLIKLLKPLVIAMMG